jgi:hypothetical protein
MGKNMKEFKNKVPEVELRTGKTTHLRSLNLSYNQLTVNMSLNLSEK